MDMQYGWSRSEFSSLINLVYSLPVSDISEMSIRSHAAVLCADYIEFLMHRDEFKEAIMTIPSLGRDILEAEIKAKERSCDEQSELLRRPEAEDGRLEEVEAVALKRFQGMKRRLERSLKRNATFWPQESMIWSKSRFNGCRWQRGFSSSLRGVYLGQLPRNSPHRIKTMIYRRKMYGLG